MPAPIWRPRLRLRAACPHAIDQLKCHIWSIIVKAVFIRVLMLNYIAEDGDFFHLIILPRKVEAPIPKTCTWCGLKCTDNLRIKSLRFYRRILITRDRPFNLGCCILPFKVASDTPFLSCVRADLVEILWTYNVTLGQNSMNISAKSVHKWLRKDVSDANFEDKIQQLKGPLMLRYSKRGKKTFSHH